MYRPTDLHTFLNEWGIHPKKALSQNFLIDGNIWRKMIASADVQPGDLVLEIGPGPGSLTQLLLEKGAHVLAVEKDEQMAQALHRLQTEDQRLEVVAGDFLTFPVKEELAKRLPKGKKAKVLANLPFSLTSPILDRLAPLHEVVNSMALIVQEEVARRFVAQPNTRDYSRFTLFLAFYADVRYGFTISKNCFYPRPKVDSAVVLLDLRPPKEVVDTEQFFALVKTAFSQRRKMVRSTLKAVLPLEVLQAALEKRGLSLDARPENLSLDDFLALQKERPNDEG